MDPCSVCGKRVGVNSIHHATCGYWVHGRCSGVRGSLARVAQGFVCKARGRKAADEFRFKDVKLECVYEFAYLGDMLNDAGGVEKAIAARVRAAWMKFGELVRILCMGGASLRMKGVVYKACVRSMLTYGAESWAMKAVVFQRPGATARRMLRMICGVTLKDMVETTVNALRVGVDNLEDHLRQKRLRWFGHIARTDEEVEIKKVFELKIEGWRKRGRPVKRWIDVVEEDMKKRGVVQQDAGYREGWRRAVKELANPH